jgi:hypothetical protein
MQFASTGYTWNRHFTSLMWKYFKRIPDIEGEGGASESSPQSSILEGQ